MPVILFSYFNDYLQGLRQRCEVDRQGDKESLNQLKAALEEKDRTIASLVKTVQQKDTLLSQQGTSDQPACTSTPRGMPGLLYVVSAFSVLGYCFSINK